MFEVCLEGTEGIRKGGNCNSPVVKEQKPKQEFSDLNREVMSYGINTTQFKVSSSDQVDYNSSHVNVHVKRYSKIFGCVREADCRVSNSKESGRGIEFEIFVADMISSSVLSSFSFSLLWVFHDFTSWTHCCMD